MYGYVAYIRCKIRAKRRYMPRATLTALRLKRAIRLAGTYLWHTNPIEKDNAQATQRLADVDKRLVTCTPCLAVCPAQAWH